jgi:membrane-associated protease RseP (regulator of RpoE activity)
MGLLVDFVEPNSPAEAAGIKQYDVLLKFNDQLLVNAEQLRALVRMKMPSDDVKFALIRRGEASSVNVELSEKEMEVVAEANTAQAPQAMKPYGFANNGQLVVGGTVMPGGGGGGYAGGGGGMMAGAMGGGGGGVMAFTNATGRNQMVLKDPEGTFNLELRGGKAVTLVAKDRTGNEIFNGPVETDEQRNALPANLADKLKKAEQGGPVRLRLTGMGGAAARTRVLSSTDKDTLLIARFENGKATHAFAFSTTDGKTLFDGPTTDDAQRKAMPEEVAKQLETLEKNQEAGVEFGVVGRNG